MRTGMRMSVLPALLAAAAMGETASAAHPSPETVKDYGNGPRARQRDTKAAFDRVHTNRRRKIALASKRRNRR